MRRAVVILTLALCACSSRKGEPPPPAASANVPTAPPGALGPLAAGSAPAPSLVTPYDPDDDSYPEEPGGPAPDPGPAPTPTPTPAPADAGVSL